MKVEYDKIAETLRKVPRRNLLAKAGKVGLVAGAVVLTEVIIKRSLLHTDQREPITKPHGLDIYPGWIGADQKTFFDGKRGPETFISAAVLGNNTLREITRRVMLDFAQAYETDTRFGLDQIYRLGLGHAREVFADIHSSHISSQVNREAETLMAGTTTIAFACSGWATASDYKALGIGDKLMLPGKDPQSSFWRGENSIARKIFPKVLPDPDKTDGPEEEPSANGEDRVRHFTMFTALYQLVLGSIEQRTNLDKSTPNILKMATGFLAQREKTTSDERKAAIFCEMAKLLYEIKSTFNLDYIPLPGRDRDQIKSGLFDPNVSKDLLVNAKAIRFSRTLRRCAEMRNKIYAGETMLLDKLKDTNLSYFQVKPILDGIVHLPKPS